MAKQFFLCRPDGLENTCNECHRNNQSIRETRPSDNESDSLEKMEAPELRQYCIQHGIPLHKNTKKKETMLKKINHIVKGMGLR